MTGLLINKTIIGLFIAITGNIINGTGYVIQKAAHNKIQARPKEEQTSFTREPMWLMGFATYAFGSVLNAIAFGFGPQALLTPMQSFSLATNACLAPHFLGEKLRGKDIMATLLILVGATLAVWFGPSSSATYTIDQLYSFFIQPVFGIFSLVLLSLALLDFIAVRLKEKDLAAKGVVMTKSLSQPGARFLALSYTGLAGVCASFAILIIKCVAEIVSKTFSGDNQFTNWSSYVMLGLVLFTNVLLEYFRQNALGRFDALFVVPAFQVCAMLFSTVLGGIFFQEFAGMELKQGLLFGMSLSIICLAIYVLSWSEANEVWRTIQSVQHILVPIKVANIFEENVEGPEKEKIKLVVEPFYMQILNEDGYNPEVYNSCFGGCLEMRRAQRAWVSMRKFVTEDIIDALRRGLTISNVKGGLVQFLNLPFKVWDGMTDGVGMVAHGVGTMANGVVSTVGMVASGLANGVEKMGSGVVGGVGSMVGLIQDPAYGHRPDSSSTSTLRSDEPEMSPLNFEVPYPPSQKA
eukprot:gb/GEZN01005425.1/.p1 GENE.gb/GEZN01005425.1/~~gb/GEZN01005425.1/.p1  ORF type:complete len:521 (-),score=70.77 gb/GEZN01005425.1/:176-1738(-)